MRLQQIAGNPQSSIQANKLVEISTSSLTPRVPPCRYGMTIKPELTSPRASRVAVFLDTSLSMSGKKIFYAKDIVKRLASILGDLGSTFEFYSFCKNVRPVQPPRDLSSLISRLLDLQLCEGTNFLRVFEALNDINADRFLVVTDGIPSIGPREPDRLVHRLQRLRIDPKRVVFILTTDEPTQFIVSLSQGLGISYYTLSGDEKKDLSSLLVHIGVFEVVPVEARIEVPPWITVSSSNIPVKRDNSEYTVDLIEAALSGSEVYVVFESLLEECGIDIYATVKLKVKICRDGVIEEDVHVLGAYKLSRPPESGTTVPVMPNLLFQK